MQRPRKMEDVKKIHAEQGDAWTWVGNSVGEADSGKGKVGRRCEKLTVGESRTVRGMRLLRA